jgi:hypothetical protein
LSNIRQLNEMVLHKLPLFQNVFLFDWQFSCANLLTNEKEINDNTHFIFLCINLLLKQKLLESLHKMYMGDFQKNEDFSFSENNLNIKWYERKVNILKQAQW